MVRTLLGRAVAFVVLTNYVALLTIGQSLHDHRDQSVSRSHQIGCSHAEAVACSHGAKHAIEGAFRDDGRPDDVEHQLGATVGDDHTCLICRFLGQKPVSVPIVRAAVCSPLIGDVEPLAPPCVSRHGTRSFDARGPPVVV